MGKRTIKTKVSRDQVKLDTKKIIEKLRNIEPYFDAISSVLEGFDGRLRTLEERLGIKHESGEATENRKEEGQESGAAGTVEADGAGGSDPAGQCEHRGGDQAGDGEEGTSKTGESGGVGGCEGSPGC